MRVVILAGGYGTRLAEETRDRPKPMVEIGGRPILWHIMKHYAHHGCDEFVVALGYKGECVKEYFLNALQLSGHLSIDFATGEVAREQVEREAWKLHLVDTGLATLTGGRLRRLSKWLSDGPFLCTYGDGVADVDIQELMAFHRAQGKLATVTAVRPPARFGGLVLNEHDVTRFTEKPRAGEGWINGGFLAFEPEVLAMIEGDQCVLESDVLERLAADGQLAAYRHEGFWQCMDTLRDKNYLEHLWQQGSAPWKTWDRPSAPALKPKIVSGRIARSA